MPDQWDALLKSLDAYNCRCGSGGPMACDEDCPGDITPLAVTDALKVLIQAVRELQKSRGEEK